MLLLMLWLQWSINDASTLLRRECDGVFPETFGPLNRSKFFVEEVRVRIRYDDPAAGNDTSVLIRETFSEDVPCRSFGYLGQSDIVYRSSRYNINVRISSQKHPH